MYGEILGRVRVLDTRSYRIMLHSRTELFNHLLSVYMLPCFLAILGGIERSSRVLVICMYIHVTSHRR